MSLAKGGQDEVGSEAAMLALDAAAGDFCYRSDLGEVYRLTALPASTLANWSRRPFRLGYGAHTDPVTGNTFIGRREELDNWNSGAESRSISGITGTIAEFNAACTDADFVTIAGSETLTNKTFVAPVLGVATGTSLALSSLTSGRVVTAGASGLLTGSANLTFDGTTQTITGNVLTSGFARVGATSGTSAISAGNLTVDSYLVVGVNVASSNGGRALRVAGTSTATASGAEVFSQLAQTCTPASNSLATYRALYFRNVLNPATGITVNALEGGYFENTIRCDGTVTSTIAVTTRAVLVDSAAAATVNVTTARCFDARGYARPSGSTTATLTTLVGYDTANFADNLGLTCTTAVLFRASNLAAGNTYTTLIGCDVAALTRGATNIGIRVAAPSGGATANYAVQLSDTGGTAAGGITFGTDVTLYRSAANTIRTDDVFALAAGLSTSYAKAGGSIYDHFTDTSVGGAEADIYTNTTPANVLGTNGDKIRASYRGNFVTVGTEATQLKVYFGGTAIWDSTAVAPATGTTSWRVHVEIIRVSSTVVRYAVSLSTSAALGYTYCTVGELTGLTLSNTNVLKITGFSSGAGSGAGDIVGKAGSVEWLSAA